MSQLLSWPEMPSSHVSKRPSRNCLFGPLATHPESRPRANQSWEAQRHASCQSGIALHCQFGPQSPSEQEKRTQCAMLQSICGCWKHQKRSNPWFFHGSRRRRQQWRGKEKEEKKKKETSSWEKRTTRQGSEKWWEKRIIRHLQSDIRYLQRTLRSLSHPPQTQTL